MVIANASVDIPALKARHPLGDTVEASGVRLRGRGRVRQGVCPFHDEVEGSFTVYADSERWYCFGCGLGGDVLDFIRQSENLSLPEAIRRLDGGAYPAVSRPAPARRPKAAPLPPRDPALLTAAARFYAGQLRRNPVGLAYLASRAIGLDAALRLGLGFAPGHGLREALESAGFDAGRLGDCGLFTERGSERFAGMVVVPDPVSSTGAGSLRRACPLARWPGLGPRREAPVPGVARPQAGAWTWASRPRSPLGGRRRGRLRLACPCFLGRPRRRCPGYSRRRAGGLGPPWLPPRLPRLRQRRGGPWGDGGACGLAWQAGRRRHPSPGRRRRGRACLPSPGPSRLPPPACTGGPLRPVAPATPPPAFPLTELPRSACLRDSLPLHSHTTLTAQSLPPTPIGGGPMPNSRRALPAHGFP